MTVAEDFGVPPDRLRHWNGLKGNDLRHGRVLVIYKPLAPGEPDRAPKRRKTAHKAVAKGKSSTASSAGQKESLNAKSQ
jgi:LysM repeat protein